MTSEAYWRVIRESRREIREQEKDDRATLEGARAAAETAHEGKADLAQLAQDKQVDASFSQSRAQIAMAVQSICSSDSGNEGGGSGEGEQQPSFFQTLLANSGILGAVLGSGGEGGFEGLLDWLVQQISPLGQIISAIDVGQTDEAAQARQIAVQAGSEIPSSAERDEAEKYAAEQRALDQLAQQAEQRAERAARREQEESAERRQLEQQLLRLRDNAVELA